jgi:fumarate hydratase subunit alpha
VRKIRYETIVESVKNLCIRSNVHLPDDTKNALEKAQLDEMTPLGRSIIGRCLENAQIAGDQSIPICQDTGLAVFFIRMGVDLKVEGSSALIQDAVNDGVRKGYAEGFLRKSVLADPLFDRKNTGDNTPAIIHLELTPGDRLEITIAPKGGGAENMSSLAMLPPAAGEEGVFRFVVESVVKTGGNPCPPVVVGVGIGGNFERSAYLAKKALIRKLGEPHPDPRYAALEKRLLVAINQSGAGVQGLGGNVTALAVHICDEPCHLASLPVAVNLNCHVHRHETVVL